MRKQWETEVKVGVFLTIGLVLVMVAVLLLGANSSLFGQKNTYNAHFNNVEGLISGAKVILGGVPVGAVEEVTFDQRRRDIYVKFTVSKISADWIRKDSTVEIATQGVLGDKYINVNTGSEDQPVLPANSELPNRPSKDLSLFLNKGDQLIISLNAAASAMHRILKNFEHEGRDEVLFRGMAATAKNLSMVTDKLNRQLDDTQIKQLLNNVRQITEKINNGTGTLGALVNDSSLYDEVKALTGGANRNRIVRNLVRQTIRSGHEKEAEAGTPAPTPTPSK